MCRKTRPPGRRTRRTSPTTSNGSRVVLKSVHGDDQVELGVAEREMVSIPDNVGGAEDGGVELDDLVTARARPPAAEVQDHAAGRGDELPGAGGQRVPRVLGRDDRNGDRPRDQDRPTPHDRPHPATVDRHEPALGSLHERRARLGAAQ